MGKILEVKNLSKKFKLSFRSYTLFRIIKKGLNRNDCSQEISALKNISFTMQKGQTIALIGDNGSGKTTLLRILSGIYQQTKGNYIIKSNFSTIFQMSLGMRPELNAIDNIYLFGAMMGVPKQKIKNKLKNIIEFAELEEFTNTPLSFFSTGMLFRLGIAVAKEIQTDLMLFDELFLGSDINFSQKSLSIFDEYKKKKRSILIASHSLDILSKVCDKALLLHKGEQIAFGEVKEIIELYKDRSFCKKFSDIR